MWIRKPKNQRRPLPKAPSNFDDIVIGKSNMNDLDKYNDDAFKEYNEKALEPWEFCGRTFLPDRLVVHLRSWGKPSSKSTDMKKRASSKPPSKTQSKFFEKKQQMAAKKKRMGGTPTKQYREPPSLTCYIWGRKYGTTSLKIHLKAWEKKWHLEQMQLPKNQRRPLPQPPKMLEGIPISGNLSLYLILRRHDRR